MKKTCKLLTVLGSLFIFSLTSLYASSSFTGYAGGMLNYSANQKSEKFDPQMD